MGSHVWIFCTLLPLILCQHHKTMWDKDHQHPKFPEPGHHSDWVNPPGGRVKTDWYALDKKRIEEGIRQAQRMIELHRPAKNVIFMMGDGMGVSTTSAARVYMAQTRNLTGEDAQLSWDRMPYTAFSKTYAVDKITPDSAATATAMMSGEKTVYNAVGVNQDSIVGDCNSTKGNEVKTILHHSIDKGKWTGVVSSMRVTHASPAAAYAHAADRDWESDADLTDEAIINGCTDISAQLIDDNQEIRVILGGGRENMLPNDKADEEYPDQNGTRMDGRNLIQEWQDQKADDKIPENKYKYVDNLADFNNVKEDEVEYLLGLFEMGHTRYNLDKAEDEFKEPTLSEMVEKAIKILQKSSEGYFLFVEGGRIDWAHHDNQVMYALSETVELSDAVQKALDLTSEDDTLLVVTADHSHVFTMGGYPDSNTNILAFDDNMIADDDKPYANLGYTNGPGYVVHRYDSVAEQEIPRINLTEVKQNMTEDKTFRFDAGIYKLFETHGGEDVAIYARGPMAHLFQGVQEQSYIGNAMMYAACVGKNQDLCDMREELCFGVVGAAASYGGYTLLISAILCIAKAVLYLNLNM